MSMENQIKWVDVAHYYQKSGIHVKYHKIEDGVESDGEILFWSMMQFISLADIIPNAPIVTFTPILRHLDDITEAEARELYRLAWGFNIDISVSAWDSGIDWVESLDGSYPSYIFHWLISHGFDLFDLIESGQAIRK